MLPGARDRDGPMARAALRLPVTRQGPGQRLVGVPGRSGALAAGAPALGPSPGDRLMRARAQEPAQTPLPLAVAGECPGDPSPYAGAECTSESP